MIKELKLINLVAEPLIHNYGIESHREWYKDLRFLHAAKLISLGIFHSIISCDYALNALSSICPSSQSSSRRPRAAGVRRGGGGVRVCVGVHNCLLLGFW